MALLCQYILNNNCLWKFLSKIVLFIAYLGFLLSRTVSIPIFSSRNKFATLTPWHTVMGSKCLFSFEDTELAPSTFTHNKKHPTHLYTRNFSSAARHQCTLSTTHGVCLCTEGWFPPHAHEPPLQQAQVGHQGFLLLPEVESRTAIFCKRMHTDCRVITIIYDTLLYRWCKDDSVHLGWWGPRR